MSRRKNNKNYRYRRHRQVKRLIALRTNSVLQEMPSAADYVFSPPQSPSSINNNTPLNDLIRSWVNCHGITTRAVNDLLRIMKSAGTRKIYLINKIK